jgi:RimJ/RimL family protein N-acetyltransferase
LGGRYQKENGFYRWAVVAKQTGKIVGSCGFARRKREDVELGYLFAREVWEKGFATEAARACLEYGFAKLGFTLIIALTDVDHFASHRVLEKIGFRRRGIERYEDDEDLVFEIEKARNGENSKKYRIKDFALSLVGVSRFSRLTLFAFHKTSR